MNIKTSDFTFNFTQDREYSEKIYELNNSYKKNNIQFEENILKSLIGDPGIKQFEQIKSTISLVFNSENHCLAPKECKILTENKVKVLKNKYTNEVLYVPVYLLAKCSLGKATDIDMLEFIRFVKNDKKKRSQDAFVAKEPQKNNLGLSLMPKPFEGALSRFS